MAYRARALGIFTTVLLTTGCGNPPLQEGTYEVELVEVVSETCGLSDEDYGVGESELVTASWDGDELVFSGAGDAGGAYEWDGDDGFSGAGSESVPIEGTSCAIRVERDNVGVFLDETTFEMEAESYLTTEGDCSDVDTTGVPCSVVLLWRGELKE